MSSDVQVAAMALLIAFLGISLMLIGYHNEKREAAEREKNAPKRIIIP